MRLADKLLYLSTAAQSSDFFHFYNAVGVSSPNEFKIEKEIITS